MKLCLSSQGIPEDAYFIGRGTEYTMSGTFRAAVVNSPAFGSADSGT